MDSYVPQAPSDHMNSHRQEFSKLTAKVIGN